VILQFAEKNQGMARVMVGDALVFENERLQQRMNQLFERIESSLRQVLKETATQRQSTTPTVDANVLSSVLICFTQGRLQRFVRSGFKRSAIEQLDASLSVLM
jgi:TetR/AcrR family transcriptional regulator